MERPLYVSILLVGAAAGVQLPVLASTGSKVLLRFSELFAQDEEQDKPKRATQPAARTRPALTPAGVGAAICHWMPVYALIAAGLLFVHLSMCAKS